MLLFLPSQGVQKRRKSILMKEQGPRLHLPNFLQRTTHTVETGDKIESTRSLINPQLGTPTKQPNKPYQRFPTKGKPAPTNNSNTIESLMANVEEIVRKSHVEAIQNANRDFWRCVAQTLDRVFLMSFFLSFIFVSAVMLLKGFGQHIK